jgi:CrcB protein
MRTARPAIVAGGAVLGAGLRWALLDLAGPAGADVVLLAVNVVGSLVLGMVLAAPGDRWPGTERSRDLLVAGFCGALTSWSGLALQLAVDTRAGDWWVATAWLAAHLVLGLGAAAAGWTVVRRGTTRTSGSAAGAGS